MLILDYPSEAWCHHLYPCKRRAEETLICSQKRGLCEEGGRAWSDVTTSQGRPAAPETRREALSRCSSRVSGGSVALLAP